ncbi:endogenous retrovirus group K member 9 Gag polyprotein-like [Perognathus longimembris pacificus]|uniref:endogenous retrovirus group K member 9 Gag polyprotein-like n=1 Tax=Perognathus longimembris pacificus TaxID=214514 RepID=UPI002018C080|nr:endogenous retrovirus group K member 9 Gag polyprotein-like [Perognathus longimembris pacificus]
MGQGISTHDQFVRGIKEALKTRGVRVRKKDLKVFFNRLDDCCPWFPQEGTIDVKRWARVGDCLKDYYRSFGPEKVPVVTFSYWNLINDILKVHSHTPAPDIQPVISQGEEVMKQSRPPSRASSQGPPSVKELSDMEQGTVPSTPKQIYPSLADFEGPKPLDPGDAAILEEEAAHYHNPDSLEQDPRPQFSQLPPYKFPQKHPFCGPLLDGHHGSLSIAIPVPSNLPDSICQLRATLEARREHLSLLKELRSLDQELSDLALQNKQPKTIPLKTKAQTRLAFPVTRSQTQYPPQSEEEDSPPPLEREEENLTGGGEDDPDTGTGEEPTTGHGQCYKRLDLRFLERLKAACSQYGPMALFTLALIENQSETWFTPNDWHFIARATLSGGDFVLWKTDYSEQARELARRNSESPTSQNWTVDKFLGMMPYDKNETQAAFPPGLLTQIQMAGLKAWKPLPQKGSATTSLAKVRQGPDEPYSDFISRLNDAAERLLGSGENESTFVKHLAFENANPACQEALRPHRERATLSDYVRLCAGVGSAHAIGLAIGAALKAANFRPSGGISQNRLCFTCKQPGHFSRECPQKQSPRGTAALPTMPSPGVTPRPLPNSLCPRCGRGFHWANECRSKTDIQGRQLLPRKSGNFPRGQPLAPTPPGALQGALQAAPQPSQVFNPSSAPPLAAQDWTSVPPPTQY